MKTVALLPTLDDGFAIAYWLRNFATWAGEVDGLAVLVSGPDAAAVPVDWPGATVIRHPGAWLEHGAALRALVDATDADRIVLCEDDAYVRTPGTVARHLAMLDDLDAIGGPRNGGSMPLLDRADELWGEQRAGDEAGSGLWPAFLFVRREALLATDQVYSPRLFADGEPVPGLGIDSPGVTSDETMVCLTWQMRAAGARILLATQYRTTDSWLMRRWLGEDPPWFHVGSLSSGRGMYAGQAVNEAGLGASAWESARRASWWGRFADAADPSDPRLPGYRAALDRMAGALDPDFVAGWRRAFDPWVTWAA